MEGVGGLFRFEDGEEGLGRIEKWVGSGGGNVYGVGVYKDMIVLMVERFWVMGEGLERNGKGRFME